MSPILAFRSHAHASHSLPSSANDIDNILGTIRASGKAIPLTPVVTIITQLEEYDDDICSRLDASVFCFIVEVALRIQCKEAERGLYLLAVGCFVKPCMSRN